MQEIICVLDKSGSMQQYAEDAKNGFNAFLKDQKEFGDANINIFWFDQGFEVGYVGSLQNCPEIDKWPIGGMTALTDAIGKTFSEVKERFSKEKPEKVILAIQTDGQENCSAEFSKSAVKELITEHEEKYGWDVIFLAADQDAWSVGQGYGIREDMSISYTSCATQEGFVGHSQAVLRSRGG